MTTGRPHVTITIRTSKDLQRWLKTQAKKNNRSLNQECEFRLLQGREHEEAAPLLEQLRQLLSEVQRREGR
jgi:hypothetical protein